MATPHIDATPGAFADTVLLPGDPLRARYIAENYLYEAECITSVRNMLGYTGTYRGQRVSVMGTGMGIPSTLIYATELITHYGVRRLLRVGTCGAVQPELRLGQLIVALGASTDSAVNRQRYAGMDFAATASWPLLSTICAAAAKTDVSVLVGNVHSTDLFHAVDPGSINTVAKMGVLAIEMEAAGLYGLAAAHGVEAAALLTVTDQLCDGSAMPAAERETGLAALFKLALDAAVASKAHA